jgi:hypothetical protein
MFVTFVKPLIYRNARDERRHIVFKVGQAGSQAFGRSSRTRSRESHWGVRSRRHHIEGHGEYCVDE